MKKNLRKMGIPLLIIFVGFFMIFIFESITTYAASTDDFWFGFNLLLKANFLYLFIALICSSLFTLFVIFINKFVKKDIIYNLYVLFLIITLVVSYIHGNYFTSKLPVLDGAPIVWSDYKVQGIISILIILLVIALFVFVYKKYNKQFYKITTYVSLAIFAMLFTSLVTTLLTNKQIYIPKEIYSSTKDVNKLSDDKNFLILLVDMVDSKTFEKTLKKDGRGDMLKDFTYFPDTLSAYGYTRESIPYIFSGDFYSGKNSMEEWTNEAYNNSKLINMLNENDYTVNIYDHALNWNDKSSLKINNILTMDSKLDKISYFKNEMKYVLYKYLPYPLKKYSKVEWLNYELCRIEKKDAEKAYISDNKFVYDTLGKKEIQKDKYFQFLHIDGAHYPWDMDKTLTKIGRTTYDVKMGSAITVIEKYLDEIKKSGQYDNSVIIIMADHGHNVYDNPSGVGRQNPILYIKGINEKHDKMQKSNKKVSFSDLNDSIYEDLLNGKKSDELLKDVDDNRKRTFMVYEEYEKIYEQTLDGHAWETKKLKNTGKIIKR